MRLPLDQIVGACTTECASFYQALMYAPVCLVAFVQALRIRSRNPAITAQLLFHIFIACFTMIRAVIDALFAFGIVHYGTPVYFILWALPGLIFFSTYSLLVVEWARVLREGHNMKSQSESRCRGCNQRVVLITANVVIYLGQAGVFVMLGWPDGSSQHKEFIQLEPLYLAIVALVSCTAFLVYGCRLYNMFANKHWASKMQRRIVSGIFTVTVFCTVCFLIRGATNVVWTKTVDRLSDCATLAFYISFYFVVEVLPSLAVLRVMRHMPRRRNHTDELLTRLPAHLQIVHEPSTRGPSHASLATAPSSEFASIMRAAMYDPAVANQHHASARRSRRGSGDMFYAGSARVAVDSGLHSAYHPAPLGDTAYGFAGSPLHAQQPHGHHDHGQYYAPTSPLATYHAPAQRDW